MATDFHCTVITPERVVLDCDADSVVFPAHDGEMGVLSHRAPLVCKLGIGPLRIVAPGDGGGAADTTKHLLFVDRGFVQMLGNRLTILTEQARLPSELDAEAARQALDQARAMRITDEASLTARANAIRRAQVQRDIAASGA